MPVQTVIKVRRDTAANWISTNPTPASGEMGLETDTNLFKFGNGTDTWTALAYSSSSRTTQIAKNDTGSSVTKGQVVYISGANGANALFSLADADSEATSSKTVGLLAQDLAVNGIGVIVTEGLLSGVNTGTATAGQSVWLSSTAGGFVFNAPPAKPAHSVYLGVVTRAHATEGEILIKVQNGYELNELHDVNAGSPADNNVLAWDSATSMWINQTAADAGLAPTASPTFTGTVTTPLTTAGFVKTSAGGVLSSSAAVAQSDVTSLTTDLAGKASLYAAVLATNVNLDNYTIPGAYDSQSGTGTNFPVTQPGMLTVKKASTGGTIYQTYQTWANGNNRLYWRGWETNVGWSPWRQVQIAGSQISTISDYTTTYGAEVGATIVSTAAAITVTLKNYSLSIGDRIDFIQQGSGQITFTAPNGTLLSAGNKLKTAGQYSAATVYCVAYGTFILIGDLAA